MSPSSDLFADTIVALSTPAGYSGIGVVRMSGPEALSVVRRIFRTTATDESFPDRRALYGRVVDPGTGNVLDDGIALVMRGPSSYTGEDVVELSLHGSPMILDMVVRLIVRLGARPATRGEFTRRALLSGKLDLIQAEAVIDLIESSSPAAVSESRARLEGALSAKIQEISGSLKDIIAELEAHIDFDEDDEEPPPRPEQAVREVSRKMEEMIQGAQTARILRDGVNTVIVGKPNVGKSTLFNALLQTDRMIVTPYPGTTRDPVEERIILRGTGFNLWDTAGIRNDPEPIEQEGIRRSHDRLASADLIIAMFDGSAPLDQEDHAVVESCLAKKTVVILNKVDLGRHLDADDPALGDSHVPRFPLSAKTGEGLESLRAHLADLGEEIAPTSAQRSTAGLNRRGLHLMEAATTPVRELLQRFDQGDVPGPEIVSLELRRALAYLEEITGERADEGILDRIFERFCVGK